METFGTLSNPSANAGNAGLAGDMPRSPLGEPLTRPRSSGTLSREGRGLWLDGRIGIESSNPLPSRERVARSRRFHQPGRAG